MQWRRTLAERHAQPHRRHLRHRRAVALEAHRLEHDAHAVGQALDVGHSAFDVEAEERPAERRCGKARGAPGDESEANCRGGEADAQCAGAASPWRHERRRRGCCRQRRPEPNRGLARQFEVHGNAQPHRDGQPEHPAATLGLELLQDPGTCRRHRSPTFDRSATLPYLRRAFWSEMRRNLPLFT